MGWPLPKLRVSGSVVVPMTIGFREPVILLPGNCQTWDAWKLRAVLAHELAHVRRGDWLVSLAASLNRSLYWFHPLAWWLERHLSTLAEQASDDAALGQLNDAPRYAGTVLEFARILQNGRRLNYGVAMARTAKVSRRIDRILAVGLPGPALLNRKTWAAIVACAVPLVYGAAALQVAQTPSATGARPGLAQIVTEGSRLSATEAQQLEEQLAGGGGDSATYGKLIAYYHTHGMAERFHEHVYALITKHPESDIGLYASHLQSGLDPDRLRALWIDAATAHPNDAGVLANAARFIGDADPFLEESLLKRAVQLDPVRVTYLADLFARAIAHPSTDEKPSFAQSARAELEASNDATLVGMVGEFLASGAPGGRDREQSQFDFAEHLLNRAQTLDPDNQEWSAAITRLHTPHEETAAKPEGVVRLRVGGEVQQANLIQRPVPVYPTAAKQARVQGLVRFSVVIGKDGRISNITLISGHPLLIPAAQEAGKQWIYRPTLLNGDPVEVATTIDVQFTLVN